MACYPKSVWHRCICMASCDNLVHSPKKLYARGHNPNSAMKNKSAEEKAIIGRRISRTKKHRHIPAWNKGISCPRDPEAVQRSAATFRMRYALGEIRHPVINFQKCHVIRKHDKKRILLRSKWEAVMAKCLDGIHAKWYYESHRFMLSSGHNYTPDFLVFYPDHLVPLFGVTWEFIEVKGRKTKEFEDKFALLKSDYPGIPIRLMDADAMHDLIIMYKCYRRHSKVRKLDRLKFKRIEKEVAKEVKWLKRKLNYDLPKLVDEHREMLKRLHNAPLPTNSINT